MSARGALVVGAGLIGVGIVLVAAARGATLELAAEGVGIVLVAVGLYVVAIAAGQLIGRE